MRLLKEELSNIDEFEGGAHQKIADSLCDLVMDTTQTGIFSIGLEGERGSGKSTVIRLLENKLGKNKVFNFDASAHQYDPIRMVFLQQMCMTLLDKSKSNNDDLIKEITTKEKISTNTTSLTLFGAICVLIAFFIPDNIVDRIGVLHMIICFLSLVAILLAGYHLLHKNKENENPYSLFSKEASINTDVECCDKTSLEFEDLFIRILNIYYANHEELVIVVDNLDRLEEDEVNRVWSMMKIFSQIDESKIKGKKLVFITPYVNFQSKKVQYNWDERRECLPNEDNNSTHKCCDYLDKYFTLRIRAPYHMMTHIKTFFIKKLKEAGVGDTACYKVYNLFHMLYSDNIHTITPREIKLFINQITILNGIHNFKWKVICYYTYFMSISKKSIEDLLQVVIYNIADPDVSCELTVDDRKQIAGLICGVKAKEGTQLLLIYEIKSLVFNGDIEGLNKLNISFREFFGTTFDKCINTYKYSDNAFFREVYAIYTELQKSRYNGSYSDFRGEIVAKIRKYFEVNHIGKNINYFEELARVKIFDVYKDQVIGFFVFVKKECPESVFKDILEKTCEDKRKVCDGPIADLYKKNCNELMQALKKI